MNIESPLLAALRDLFMWSRPSWSSADVMRVASSSSVFLVNKNSNMGKRRSGEMEKAIAYRQ